MLWKLSLGFSLLRSLTVYVAGFGSISWIAPRATASLRQTEALASVSVVSIVFFSEGEMKTPLIP